MSRRHLFVLLGLVLSQGLGRAAGDVLLDSFTDLSAWAPNHDGGSPPVLSLAPGKEGTGLRLRYHDVGRRWGNVRRPVVVPKGATAIRFWLRIEHARRSAALHVWLLEKDGDGYVIRVRPGGHELWELDDAWRQVTLPFSAFRFVPRGDRNRAFLSLDHLLLGCNFADLIVEIDELAFAGTEVKPVPLPRTRNLRLRPAHGDSVAILDEPTFPPEPGFSNPARLTELLTSAGFAVTRLRAGDVADARILTPEHFTVLVVPCAPFYPAAGRAALIAYLKKGGAFCSLGGYAFDRLVVYSSQGWTSTDPAVTAAEMDAQRQPTPGLNTRFGKPGDTMGFAPEQIPVFDPAYQFHDVVAMRAAGGQDLLPADWRAPATLEGFPAVVVNGSNSPVFPDVYSRWIPLLTAVDAWDRPRGPVGALVHNFAGPYARASWAVFGVTNEDLFDGRRPALDRLLVATIRRLCAPLFLHDLKTDLACYRQGEPVTLSVVAVTSPQVRKQAVVRFDLDDHPLARVPVPADPAAPVTYRWSPESFARDFYRVKAVLEVDGAPVDECETGFVVWNEDVVRSGPTVGQRNSYFTFREKPTFLCGTNQTGMMWYSANENPLVWERDFQKMSDCGINVLRLLHFSAFARETGRARRPFSALDLRTHPLDTRRKTDAMVQLAQKHDLVLFLTLHDWIGVALTDEELKAEREWARFWAGRYRHVPGLLFDIQNEPSVHLSDRPPLHDLARQYLTERYGSVTGAQRAWKAAGSSAGLQLTAKPTGPHDLRARDLDLFRAWLFQRWTQVNVEGVKAGNPAALVTVGHLQNVTAADKLLGARDLDFTCTHFYGSVATFRRLLKMVDLRCLGKSFTLGEFGAREAHNARTAGALGDPADQSIPYFLAVGHYALGMGATLIANWDWKEMRGCVFPWGINHRDGVSKPVLEAYRNMSFLFRLTQPVYRPPAVLLVAPDSSRFGARSDEVHRGLLQAVDWLFDCQTPFGIINEYALDRLPGGTRALLWPLPDNPDDATFARICDFVTAGGALLVTGEFRFAPSRKPSTRQRLATLGLLPDAGGQAQWAACGQGRVCWIRAPLELSSSASGAERYAEFLDRIGIPRLRVAPGNGIIHAFQVPLENGVALIAYNQSNSRQTVTVAGSALGRTVRFELEARRPGMLVATNEGAVVAAEAQGVVAVGDRRVFQCTGHLAIAALDGRDLAESRQLVLLPFGPGKAMIPRAASAPALAGEVGEMRAGRWRRLEVVSVGPTPKLTVTVPDSSPRDLRLLSPARNAVAARAALARLVTRR